MAPEDIPAVHEIEARSYAITWHEDAYLVELGNQCACYLSAHFNGQVVGYAGMWVVADEAHITTMAVDPPYRGRRIGERLFLGLMEEAVRRGAERASLEVRERNLIAQRLYKRFGYREAAIRKKYYSDNHENAIVMWVDNMRSSEYLQLLRDVRQLLDESQ